MVNLISPDQNIKPFETIPPETIVFDIFRRTVEDRLEGLAHSRYNVTRDPVDVFRLPKNCRFLGLPTRSMLTNR